jgi:hypothetical protein
MVSLIDAKIKVNVLLVKLKWDILKTDEKLVLSRNLVLKAGTGRP